MKKVEIYKDNELQFTILANSYLINTYENTIEITYEVNDIKASYTIPLNKGYKILVM